MTGWISIHRQILDCGIWDTDEPYSKRDAWIFLLLKANHEDKDMVFDGHKITIKRGQYLTSVRKLAEIWHWGKDKTLKYLRLLEECEMIVRNADSRRTLLTLVNYEFYQGEGREEQTVSRQSTDSKQTVSRQSSATNNNVNNVNNENNENKYICAFEEFWKIYPKKKDKGTAYKCYQARLNCGYLEEELLTACKNYAAECEREKREQKYIKNGATFLSVNEPFRDYLKGEGNGYNSTRNITAAEEERNNREIDEYLASDEYRNNDERPFA